MSAVKGVGSVFRLRSSLRDLHEELIPRLDQVLEDWLNNIYTTRFAEPSYIREITYITEPFKILIESIINRLQTFGVIGAPLERSFGFGKTHSLIFLWHLFTSDIYKDIKSVAIPEEVIRESLVLAADYSSKRTPFSLFIEELKKYTDPRHPIGRIKDPKLIQAIQQTLSRIRVEEIYTSSKSMAETIAEILRTYKELGRAPKLLLFIDELGYSITLKMREYIETLQRNERSAETIYAEINEILNFLDHLYANLSNLGHVSAVVIWVVAEQDKRLLKILADKYQDNPYLYKKIIAILEELEILAQRYSRGMAGVSLFELSYSPTHAIKIALHRVLKPIERVDRKSVSDVYISWLKKIAKQLNLEHIVSKYERELSEYYPLSLGFIHLLMKLMNQNDIPATEFVRTVIYYVAQASERALNKDPETICIGVKHLKTDEIAQVKLLGQYADNWISTLTDLENAIQNIEGSEKELAELIIKYILAKGLTANISALLFEEDKRLLERYGTSIDEIQIELLQSFNESTAMTYIDKIIDIINKIIATSARVDEKDINGKRLYFPSILKTIYDKLAVFILDEKKKVSNENMIPIYIRDSFISQIFSNVVISVPLCRNEIDIMFVGYDELTTRDQLVSIIRKSQGHGHLGLLVVPPWDISLFREVRIKKRAYNGDNGILRYVSEMLQRLLNEGEIRRHLHIIVLIPNLASIDFNRLIEDLTVFQGTTRFLSYLKSRKDVIDERLREIEGLITKRHDLLALSEEIRNKQRKIIEERVLREINEAEIIASKQLVRLSRELVARILNLYSKVIYYSIDSNRYVAKDLYIENISGQKSSELSDLNQHAAIVNRFFEKIINDLGFTTDINKVSNEVADMIVSDIEAGKIAGDELTVNDLIENIMIGTYKLKPTCITVAKKAVEALNGFVKEIGNKKLTFIVDQNKLKLLIEPISIELSEISGEVEISEETTEKTEVVAPTVSQVSQKLAYVNEISLVLMPEHSVEEFRHQLKLFNSDILKEGVIIKSIKIDIETDMMEISLALKKVTESILEESSIKALLNLMSKIRDSTKRSLKISILLSNHISEDVVVKTLGKYYKHMRSSFDKFLPM